MTLYSKFSYFTSEQCFRGYQRVQVANKKRKTLRENIYANVLRHEIAWYVLGTTSDLISQEDSGPELEGRETEGKGRGDILRGFVCHAKEIGYNTEMKENPN